jgi:predicted phosphoribosyltransferase
MSMDLITVDKIAALKEENRALRLLAEEDATNYSVLQMRMEELEEAYAQSKSDYQRRLSQYSREVSKQDALMCNVCRKVWFWRIVAIILFIVVII